MRPREAKLAEVIAGSPLLAPMLAHWGEIEAPDVWLAAGAIAQTCWNQRFGFDPLYGINDVDIVYFDPDHLDEASEARAAELIERLFPAVRVRCDVKNEARVHLWYRERFGYDIAPYRSIGDAVATFPTTATAIAVRPVAGSLDVIAPFGLDDLLDGVVRPNKQQITRQIYERKLERWRRFWPELRVVDWDEGSSLS